MRYVSTFDGDKNNVLIFLEQMKSFLQAAGVKSRIVPKPIHSSFSYGNVNSGDVLVTDYDFEIEI